MGRTRSFLDFSNPAVFSPHLSFQEVGFGLLAVLWASPSACCGLAVRARYDHLLQAGARPRPAGTKLAALLPGLRLHSAGAVRTVHPARPGPLAILGRAIGSADPYQNPLLFLLPALLITGLSLLILRVLPALLDGLAALAARLPGAVPALVLRQFARSGNAYQGMLLLITLTLGLAAFASSMAASLDTTLSDGISYQVGADLTWPKR